MRSWRAWTALALVAYVFVFPATLTAAWDNWQIEDVLAVLPSLPSLPPMPLIMVLTTIIAAAACGWMASRAQTFGRLALAAGGAAMAGGAFILANQALPLYRVSEPIQQGLVSDFGRGIVVRVQSLDGQQTVEVLRGGRTVTRGSHFEVTDLDQFRALLKQLSGV
ncbi:hypothetical protein [Paracraurococcus ruber]|nr:hypothetical protein [Paracraurococcus ruber]TDG33736.1 hypothetical protein E2C05_02655 [Paracraurococcus ruber]